MSGPGPALRGYNAELQEGLAELRARREELSGRIREEEAERGRLQGRLWALTQRLARTSESLARNLAARGELDRTITETEAAYGKGNPGWGCPGVRAPGPGGPASGRPGFGLGESTLSKHSKKPSFAGKKKESRAKALAQKTMNSCRFWRVLRHC
ncbi:uncharacterized protein FN964_012949 isoform 1-T1 [Alca torda]